MKLDTTIAIDGLIERCRDGNRQAQEQLYQIFAPKMFAVCLRYAATNFEAEDILQVGFVKVFNGLGSFKGTGSIAGWIRRIMVNTAIASYRKNRQSALQVELDESLVHVGQEVEMGNLACEDLLRLIQSLPEGYRLVFNMFAIEGYSHEEIAKELGISEGTSKSQLSRARAWLKEKIENMEGAYYDGKRGK